MKKSSELFDAYEIPYEFTLDNTVDAFEISLQGGKNIYLPKQNGHPNEEGYKAYARAAYDLWEKMNQ